jgi:two-component system sensor histidine kinase RegB
MPVVHPSTLPQHETLRSIVLMRTIVVCAQLSVITFAHVYLGIDLQLPPVLLVIGLLVLLNIASCLRLRQVRALHLIGHLELLMQLLADVAALSAILYFSGGATNPFVSFYLPALAVAAALLPWQFALLLAILAITAYSLLTNLYVPLQIHDTERAINLHLAGMWANFAASALLITLFVARLSSTLRQRDAELAQARERHLEHERLIALGMQAAHVAHEIGTPLSTVAIIAGELRHEAAQTPALHPYRDEFVTIESQIAICKTALDRMGAQANETPGAPVSMSATSWLRQFITEWRLRYPAVRLQLTLPEESRSIQVSTPLSQILTVLLDNATQAAAGNDSAISLSLSHAPEQVVIRIEDHGAGIVPELLERLGQQAVPSRRGGQGIGLLLAFTAARQIGASIRLESPVNGSHSGTCATLSIAAP